MSCYFLYAMAPIVEVALVPTGYVLGHALSSVQQSASSSQEIIFHSEKYLHHVSESTLSLDIPQVSDLEKPVRDTSTRPDSRQFRRRRGRGSRNRGVKADTSRRHDVRRDDVRRHRMRTKVIDHVNEATVESGLSQNNDACRKRLNPNTLSTLESSVLEKPLLYCDLCRVKLNASLQAKQHFEGKTHAKKLKLSQMCSTTSSNNSKTVAIADTTGTTEDAMTSSFSSSSTSFSSSSSSSSSSGSELPVAKCSSPDITSPDIYCSVCGISFNSDKQSKQHYRGKLHAKKQRLANHLSRCAARKRLRASAQEESRQRVGRINAKENHTPESRDCEMPESSRTATR